MINEISISTSREQGDRNVRIKERCAIVRICFATFDTVCVTVGGFPRRILMLSTDSTVVGTDPQFALPFFVVAGIFFDLLGEYGANDT